jgi:serine/threonine-protein kinase
MKMGLRPPEPVASLEGTSAGQPAAAPIDGELHPGEILDERFALTELISRGGMATIFKAQDLQNGGEQVAIKIPHREVEMDAALFSRFQREEQIGTRLSHPYILKFLPVYRKKSRPYLVTEFVRGTTLYHLLDTFRVFPESDALAIASLICEALEYLHENGVVHRDLKPENVMICFDGTIRVMDFGIACAADSRRITFIGFAPGTPHYMAPERIKLRRGDPRTDLYSLGAVLYEMLTGAIAYAHDDTNVIMSSRVVGDPVPPRDLNPRISPQVEEIVLRTMDRNPNGRHPSAAALKAELDAPGRVVVTGRRDHLKPATPWRRGMRIFRKAVAWCLIPVVIQVVAFLLLWHHLARK